MDSILHQSRQNQNLNYLRETRKGNNKVLFPNVIATLDRECNEKCMAWTRCRIICVVCAPICLVCRVQCALQLGGPTYYCKYSLHTAKNRWSLLHQAVLHFSTCKLRLKYNTVKWALSKCINKTFCFQLVQMYRRLNIT